jgi:hypothetical protein
VPSAERSRGCWACGISCLLSMMLLSSCSGPPPVPPQPSPVKPPVPAVKPPPAPATSPSAVLRNQQALERYAATRLVEFNPGQVYLDRPPEALLAIPVLRVDLHADGRVRRITVLREPRQAKDTVQLAIAAVHRAAPYGDLSRLPEPRMFVETFLFNDDRRFKPRGLQ